MILLALLAAAVLEAGGDALIRGGLHRSGIMRAAFFACGAIALFGYGGMVNAPPWDFGRLLGIYVVFFFLIAQLVAWLAFGKTPSVAILIGGALIVAGGVVIAIAE